MRKYKFIDLFAGLGGFHLALKELGHKCVFASEINPVLRDVYHKNFSIFPKGDITKINSGDIPKHDILCAGFPCTPFSKAGKRMGRKDKKQGKLFDEILRILDHHKPKFFILENVSNLHYHNERKTLAYIKRKLSKIGYEIASNIYSPHEFGIPQYRRRVFIVGSLSSLKEFAWIDKYKVKSETNIESILEKRKNGFISISKEQKHCVSVWQKFLDVLPATESLEYPIWAMEFGANYPFETKTPFTASNQELGKSKGVFGISLGKLSREDMIKLLPTYAQVEQNEFPDWKKRFIRSNRELYNKYMLELKPILPLIKNLPVPSWRKFEWNCNSGPRIVKNYILQFRASGLRVKKNNFAPSLVSPKTQIPIIGWEDRYISRKETLRLQSMEKLKYLPKNDTAFFRALGNAVNVTIVKLILKELLG